MTLKEIYELALSRGEVCEPYREKLKYAATLKEVMDIAMDINGLEWLCKQSQYNYCDYRQALLNLATAFINGRYTARYSEDKNNGYTTSLYVGTEKDSMKDIEVDSTVACFLCVKATVYIPKNQFVRIYADKDSTLSLHLDKDARCEVNVYGNGIILISPKSKSSSVLINK